MQGLKHWLWIPLLAICAIATSQSLPKRVVQVMDSVRSGTFTGTYPFKAACEKEPDVLVRALAPYTTDTLYKVRSTAHDYLYQTAMRTTVPEVRKAAVQYLVFALNDKNAGLARTAGLHITSFKRVDFSPASVDSIVQYIRPSTYYVENAIQLAGYLGGSKAQAAINAFANSTTKNDKALWAAHLALARMGNATETEWCINLVKGKGIDDNAVYHMLPGLIYTRQRAAFDYLITILNSNERSCLSPNPNNGGQIICGYRVMEMLAPVVVDFPLQTDASGRQIKTKNYDQALQTAREWFKVHGGDYGVRDEGF